VECDIDVASCRWLRCAAFGCSLLSLEGLVVSPLCELDPTAILPTVGVLKGRTVVLWRAADPVEAA
jgi:hypothetical protein